MIRARMTTEDEVVATPVVVEGGEGDNKPKVSR